MKMQSYKILFRLFSFLSDKTNGSSLFVKYKLMLGTLIIGLSATSCHKSRAIVTCYEIEPVNVDTIEVLSAKDTTVSATKDTIGKHTSPKPVPVEAPETTFIISCYEITIPEPTCYMPAYPDPVVPDPKQDEIFPYEGMETPPVSPVGNLEEFFKWIGENIEYPESMLKNGEQGRVMVRFIIDKEGKITDINILRTFSPDADKEVIRVLKLSPDWTPGKHRGHKVKTKITIPIIFRLPKDDVSPSAETEKLPI
ncbi:energy transducer TonB [Dysgonomonas sp. 25]|uniref:energy transducer TonB n=1 Tax=Dysgonomonas sp. 25 TaxID=2302933 RepID=UPI0013D4CAB4|nr:energy transducer TonB [Dysgonomonas sp. 25]NDV67393.1 energy transducer TonB [Dysgonomonas sp. 25]